MESDSRTEAVVHRLVGQIERTAFRLEADWEAQTGDEVFFVKYGNLSPMAAGLSVARNMIEAQIELLDSPREQLGHQVSQAHREESGL